MPRQRVTWGMLRRCAVVVTLLLSSVAVAQQPQIEVKPQFKPGERIVIAVTPPLPTQRIAATLAHDGKRVAVAHGATRAGERALLTLPGAGHYEGDIVTTFRDGSSFKTHVA